VERNLERGEGCVSSGEPDVELRAVTKRYGAAVAVQSLDLSIAKGEFVTLLGPSGCGKTTTLRMIGGFEEPTSGEVFVTGRPVSRTPKRDRQTRMVFQSYALFPHMTVLQNVAYGLRMQGVARPEIVRRVGAALEMTGIAAKASAFPRDLSGGQQQRTALARALVTRPTVLLLDEPLGALDLKMRRRLQAELKTLQRELGITFVYVTHDQEEALALSDRIVVMHNGEIEQQGTPAAIYCHPASAFVADFVGETNLFRRAGSRDLIAIRPERIALQPASADVSGRAEAIGRVTAVTFLGPFTRVTLRLADGQTLRADAAEAPSLGSEVEISWAAADAVLFENDMSNPPFAQQDANA
jgi:ABC-type Fe3+/spermidine/putrescine transport system ATPase subunit